MARINVKPPTLKVRLLVGLGVVVSIGALLLVGWGIGWMAHRVFSAYGEPAPTETVWLTVTASVVAPTVPVSTGVPTDTPSEPTAVQPTTTPMMTSTPLSTPESAPAPTVRTYIVRRGDGGLAAIAGKVCPNLADYRDREAFAYEIQRANPGKIQDIAIVPSGIELVIPPCPP